ncbi:hypothetical protein GA0115240_11246 [Streptomyces sp. DvalAA-14]|nr:hypothetical protein GA0115240_11246 [Streptomyces sp. DvalAA-14]
MSPLTANSVSDTRGVTPRVSLGAADERSRRGPVGARSVTSAASVSLTRPLLPPGTVPLVTPAVAEPPRSSVLLH